jgi:hypothetical protein
LGFSAKGSKGVNPGRYILPYLTYMRISHWIEYGSVLSQFDVLKLGWVNLDLNLN